jgi:neutral ceramidase
MTASNSFLAGWASQEITPDIPCRMGGYGDRAAPASAIHDALYANALALGTREQPFVVVTCDLIGVDELMTREVRQRVAVPFPGARVWLGATHTHSGPDVARSLSFTREPPDPAIWQRIIAGASAAALTAITRMHPVWARWTDGAIDGIATNRDHPEIGADLTLAMLCLYDEADRRGQPAALFGSFPCHPTVLGSENLAISADLAGAFRTRLHALLGDETWIALATGAAGDISTRHMRQGQGFAELERLGGLLAQQANALLTEARPLGLALPHVQDTVVKLEPKEPLLADKLAVYTRSVQDRARAEQRAGNASQARTLETVLQGLRASQVLALSRAEDEASVVVSAALMGELALAAIPGELYNELGVLIRRAGERPVLLLGYTNGYAGYIPTRAAYAELDYEVLVSPFAPGSGERLASALGALLKQHSSQG